MRVTLVSTLPFMLTERKPGLIPEYFEIPAAPRGHIALEVINDCYHLMLIPLSDEKAPPVSIPDFGEKVAQSIIQDYIQASLGADFTPLENGAVPIPGMFWVEGKLNKEEVLSRYSDRVKIALGNTKAWFQRLIIIADDDWKKFHQHKMITDTQRKACKYLELDREWNFDVFEQKINLCWACKTSLHPDAIVCSGCKAIINKEAFEKRKDQFVTS